MENKTNKVICLDDNKEYLILRQILYKNDTYYVTNELYNDGEDFSKEFTILKETNKDGKTFVSQVTDSKIIKIIVENIE